MSRKKENILMSLFYIFQASLSSTFIYQHLILKWTHMKNYDPNPLKKNETKESISIKSGIPIANRKMVSNV